MPREEAGVHQAIDKSQLSMPSADAKSKGASGGVDPAEIEKRNQAESITRGKLYKRTPKRVEYQPIIISGDSVSRKVKLLCREWFDDGKGRSMRRQRVACIMKGGRVLQGRWPEGVPKVG